VSLAGGAVLAALLVIAVACSASPTAPVVSSSVPLVPPGRVLSLQAGSYTLDLIGFGGSLDPEFPPCDPPALQGGRTAAWTIVSLDREQGDWVARTSTSPGSLELRFRQIGDSIGGFIVSGWISGKAADMLESRPPSDRGRVFLAGPGHTDRAVVRGVADRSTTFLTGSVSGEIFFTNNESTALSRCTVIMWVLQPMYDQSNGRRN
jgi:hypothetical protein